jgi:hypothetical protein
MITFQGTEELSIECTGSFSKEQARALVPSSLEIQSIEERAVLGLLYFKMHKLSAFGLGWPAFSYEELFWRIGIVIKGEPAWFGFCCEINQETVRKSAAILFRYPTQRSNFDRLSEFTISTTGREETTIQARPQEETETIKPRRLFVSKRGRIYEIYWAEKAASRSQAAQITIQTTRDFEELHWQPNGLLLQGRTHICGVAKKFL